LAALRACNLAGCGSHDFAGDQFHARDEQDDYRSDPKDKKSRLHDLIPSIS
jgi:hypothetical protein